VSASRIAPAPPQQSRAQRPPDRFLKRPQARDVLAWMRLLVDPQDAAAVVRALSRPPIELRQVELARVIQVARRRKRDLVLGVAATTESPQVPLEARERVRRFVELHRAAAAELDTVAPDVFVAQLIQRLGVPGRELLMSGQDASLARLCELAGEFVRSHPGASTRDLTRHLATVAPEPHEELSGEEQPESDGSDRLQQTLQLLRQELLDGVARIGGRLGELRLDTDLDVSHGVARYLELLKLSALLQRPEGQSLTDALADINARLLAAATPLQREILQTSTLDETLLAVLDDAAPDGDRDRALARAIAPREEHSLSPFLPRRGVGAALSASDIYTYRSCPLRYKFARVMRIPTAQTVHQRFGIVVHQVLERFHSEQGDGTRARMQELLDVGWRRAGFGDGERDRELFDKAQTALSRYHERLGEQDSEPVWFERQFDFRVGPHHVRGRVDRVDRVAGSESGERSDLEYELIDYKTSRPKTAEQLRDDVQLSLYALAAREDWQLPSSRQSYYYVLDDLKVPVQSVTDVVLEVGEGVLAQQFEPTPSPTACGMCDYRIVCPAAEA
jgi:DNA helicase II / ATP-dependent DNA helicase PcrA